MEVPRVSGMLRTFLFDRSGELNVHDELLKRVEFLKKHTFSSVNDADSSTEYGSGITFDFSPPVSSLEGLLDSIDLAEPIPSVAPKPVAPPVRAPPQPTPESEASVGIWHPSNESRIDNTWLLQQCQNYTQFLASARGQASTLSAEDLSRSILSVLQNEASSEVLQSQLFDMLSESGVEFIQTLLAKRRQIVMAATRPAGLEYSGAPARPSYGTQITIKTEAEKKLEKQQRKLQRKGGGGGSGGAAAQLLFEDLQALRAAREQALALGPSEPLLPAGSTGDGHGFGSVMLPEGTQRRQTKDYEEVRLPADVPAPAGSDERLVAIAEFDEWARPAFRNTKALNRVQSRVFEAAYRTNENLLVCAPTGAGKTNVAMMAILRELGTHIVGGQLIREGFKIIYVAPMKALAQEMVATFGSRLAYLGVVVKELTGDMQLTRKELVETQLIVTTPEKWDVITRKSGDMALTQLVRLLIIDEVHLLHEDRGPVIESLVARTLRQVETTQSMIRIVGLSATLPSYRDVAAFLHVNPATGLFFFDGRYRPVPLSQQYIGVKDTNPAKRLAVVNEVCYQKVHEAVASGHQVMVFVHARKDTVKTAEALRDMALVRKAAELFAVDEAHPRYAWAAKEMAKSKNRELRELFPAGFAVHHAGMLRPDRSLVERLFADGLVRVLVCTATLAWGVNLPAHTVVIKGTQLYDSRKGTFVELGMLDVMQIFGRAGRPQYDTSGEGIIITSHAQLPRYLSLLTHQLPIESQFVSSLADNLNAEVVLGTVTTVAEAVTWLSYTYLYIRMRKNPLAYGIPLNEKETDPLLEAHREQLVRAAAKTLDECQMVRYSEHTGTLAMTELGRVASHYYVSHETIRLFNEKLHHRLKEPELLELLSQCSEFTNIKVREEEGDELERLEAACPVEVRGGPSNEHGKVNILLQAYLSGARVEEFSLVSDLAYVVQNAGRLCRALFEIVLKRGWAGLAATLLRYCLMIDRRMWASMHPLRQFENINPLLLHKLEEKKISIDRLREMTRSEVAQLIGHPKQAAFVQACVRQFPAIEVVPSIQPITRTVLKVQLELTADFEWNERVHGTSEPWWIWIEDGENEHIYHTEHFVLERKTKDQVHKLTFTVPVFEPLPPQYYVHILSDRWLAAETVVPISFKHLILPEHFPPHTELLDLHPLPVSVLGRDEYEALYGFSHFNPIQTQAFHTLYHTDHNVLLGSPTGSGKTIAAELAILRLWNTAPARKVVYVAPLKALVRERFTEWHRRFTRGPIGKKVVELTGDYTPDIMALKTADVVVTTPEKWDGISRSWQQRSYVKAVGLMVLDEIHMLGEERGPVLEVIVSRMRYIASQTDCSIRFVGLSTALANARDLSDWLGITPPTGLFNFKPSVRPVPLTVHIQGFPGKNYCPRMASMNKPTYQAILTHSPFKPALVFVSSRRQTRLTALDLISFCAADGHPRQFLHMLEDEIDRLLDRVRDSTLRHTLAFGIGVHHAGLTESDKALVEDLFLEGKIQVLVCTATLAWGVNLPAHLVVIKGTEYYEAKTKRYEDFPITDVLQMMGRAGRPQFDQEGVAVVLVHEPKKNFYKKFLYDPFPVESSLLGVLHDHLNAEIVAGTIASKQDAIDYLTWTFFFRRLIMNPSYYGLEGTDTDSLNRFLSQKIDDTLADLEAAHCVQVGEDETSVEPLTLGRIAAYYYLRHTTARLFYEALGELNDLRALLDCLCSAGEYDDLPVRHNEDKLNEKLAADVPWPVDMRSLDSPHTKANLLLQAHLSRAELPVSDYITDTKSVLDQAVRILQAMVDVCADGGWLFTTLNTMHLAQRIAQALWFEHSPLLTLPHASPTLVDLLEENALDAMPLLLHADRAALKKLLETVLTPRQTKEFLDVLDILPLIDMKVSLKPAGELEPGTDASIAVSLQRLSKPSNFVYAPNFPKKKQESWWLVLGDAEHGELLALRRLTMKKSTTTELLFDVPDEPGTYSFYVYLMSDSYVGLDQQQVITFSVKAGGDSQPNEESKEA